VLFFALFTASAGLVDGQTGVAVDSRDRGHFGLFFGVVEGLGEGGKGDGSGRAGAAAASARARVDGPSGGCEAGTGCTGV
jgi:hypothetical protein